MTVYIHALREEGDEDAELFGAKRNDIFIHALREEGDSVRRAATYCTGKFLSTPSARRAT